MDTQVGRNTMRLWNGETLRDCGMAKSSEPIKWQDSNTPTLTPYKAFSGALLL